MKQNLTWLVFVIDRSGSMSSIAADMIGGFNRFVKDQKALPGECKVFAYQFDDHYDTICEGMDIKDVPELTDRTYVPRGSTALYPSLGKTICDIGRKLAELKEEDRPEKVLFVTITDGEHNHDGITNFRDVVYSSKQIKEMITTQTEKYNWAFAYLGANQDSWAVGSGMGYSQGTTLNYVATRTGVADMYSSLCDATTMYRCTKGAKFAFKAADKAGKIDDPEDGD